MSAFFNYHTAWDSGRLSLVSTKTLSLSASLRARFPYVLATLDFPDIVTTTAEECVLVTAAAWALLLPCDWIVR